MFQAKDPADRKSNGSCKSPLQSNRSSDLSLLMERMIWDMCGVDPPTAAYMSLLYVYRVKLR